MKVADLGALSMLILFQLKTTKTSKVLELVAKTVLEVHYQFKGKIIT